MSRHDWCAFAASFLLVIPPVLGEDIDCGFFNEIEITDPAGDATPGAPSYVDILGIDVRQFRDRVQFRWWSDGNPYNSDRMYFFIYLDTDLDPTTGAGYDAIGVEVKIGVNVDAYVHRFDAAGNWITAEGGLPVIFKEDGFVFEIDLAELATERFTLYFESNGEPGWRDEGSVHDIALQPARQGPSVVVESNHTVLDDHPPLINIPDRETQVQLQAFLMDGTNHTELTSSQVEYAVFHGFPLITDAESIISIDENGVANYHSEGYVLAAATVRECGLNSEVMILATGDVYGDPEVDQVLAVWPTDYSPNDINLTYGEIMDAFPNYIHALNVAYQITSDLYSGFRPYGGDKQILAVLEVDSWCHAGNPIQSPPGCYFGGNGSPNYTPIVHEMGHNFQQSTGMALLGNSELGFMGFGECSASLPVIYMFSEISQNGGRYSLGPGTYEWDYFDSWRQMDGSNFDDFDEFENQISSGQIQGIFDEDGDFDGVAMFCCFFQVHMYGHGGYTTQYGHHLIRRFLHVFDDEGFEDFQHDKIETYFVAAFSAAAGKDLRNEFRFWGFDVDDQFYGQIMPDIEARLMVAATPPVFEDGFESGNTSAWDFTVP